MKANQLRRDLVRKAHDARAEYNDELFDRIWNRMNRLEQAMYDVEEWEAELKLRSKGKFSCTFMPLIPPREQLKMLGELERFCGDDFTATRIERVRRNRCFCDWPDSDEGPFGGTDGGTMPVFGATTGVSRNSGGAGNILETLVDGDNA